MSISCHIPGPGPDTEPCVRIDGGTRVRIEGGTCVRIEGGTCARIEREGHV